MRTVAVVVVVSGWLILGFAFSPKGSGSASGRILTVTHDQPAEDSSLQQGEPGEPPAVSRVNPHGERVAGDTPQDPAEAFANCTTAGCHSEKKDHAFSHGPVYVNACNTCHEVSNPETFTVGLARPIEKLCVFCHEQEIHEGEMVHEPFEAGACVSCHSPHGGSDQRLLRLDHYSDLCLSCHEDLIGARELIHGPAAEGACSACHQPHTSDSRKLLVADGRAMCLSCHAEIGNLIETASVVHEPVQNDCQLCHDPHATDNPAMLLHQPADLCMGCHEDIQHELADSATPHGAITTERSCLNCHSPHASDHNRLLRNDVMQLCFECHDQEIERENGHSIANIKRIIETGTSLHSPVAEGNCALCHEIHGGDHSRLLVREYPNSMYAPFEQSQYALCFGCHDRSMVENRETATVTAFRNGTKNLHAVHVNRETKGRTCAVCHDAHASTRAQHIRDTVPFGPGGWELPIHFKQTAEGGSCASGCHTAVEYNRSNPVEYPSWTEQDD